MKKYINYITIIANHTSMAHQTSKDCVEYIVRYFPSKCTGMGSCTAIANHRWELTKGPNSIAKLLPPGRLVRGKNEAHRYATCTLKSTDDKFRADIRAIAACPRQAIELYAVDKTKLHPLPDKPSSYVLRVTGTLFD